VSSAGLRIRDSQYISGTATQFKQAISGTMLVFPLATPTTEQADPYASPQVVNPLGTEEYIDTRDVPVLVGHETEYGMSQLVLTNPTEFDALPLIKISGIGTVGIGEYLITISGIAEQTIYIDCDTMEIYKYTDGELVSASSFVSFATYDFPKLVPGINNISVGTGITEVIITPRWWII
jgi:hypothetical protein